VYLFLFVKVCYIITQCLNLGCPNPCGAHMYPIFCGMFFERVGGLFVNVGVCISLEDDMVQDASKAMASSFTMKVEGKWRLFKTLNKSSTNSPILPKCTM